MFSRQPHESQRVEFPSNVPRLPTSHMGQTRKSRLDTLSKALMSYPFSGIAWTLDSGRERGHHDEYHEERAQNRSEHTPIAVSHLGCV